jgi:hypothetical protein
LLFDAVPAIDYGVCKEPVSLNTVLWNEEKEGAWYNYLGEIGYGVEK